MNNGKPRTDAERYQWLRRIGSARGIIDWGELGVAYQDLDGMDSAIDAEISKAEPERPFTLTRADQAFADELSKVRSPLPLKGGRV